MSSDSNPVLPRARRFKEALAMRKAAVDVRLGLLQSETLKTGAQPRVFWILFACFNEISTVVPEHLLSPRRRHSGQATGRL